MYTHVSSSKFHFLIVSYRYLSSNEKTTIRKSCKILFRILFGNSSNITIKVAEIFRFNDVGGYEYLCNGVISL